MSYLLKYIYHSSHQCKLIVLSITWKSFHNICFSVHTSLLTLCCFIVFLSDRRWLHITISSPKEKKEKYSPVVEKYWETVEEVSYRYKECFMHTFSWVILQSSPFKWIILREFSKQIFGFSWLCKAKHHDVLVHGN